MGAKEPPYWNVDSEAAGVDAHTRDDYRWHRRSNCYSGIDFIGDSRKRRNSSRGLLVSMVKKGIARTAVEAVCLEQHYEYVTNEPPTAWNMDHRRRGF